MDGDHIGVVDGKDIVDRLDQVGLTAEHRRTFGEGTGGCQYRIFIMAGQGTAMVGTAPLRAVAVGQAAMNAEGGVHRTDGLAGLGRINGQGLARFDFFGGMS